MKKLWHKLDLDPTGALRDDLDLSFVDGPDPQYEWTWGAYEDELADVFNEQWLDYMESKNCRPTSILVFYKPVNWGDNIHIDGEQFVNYGVNLIANPGYVNGTGADQKYKNWKDTATMKWYNTDVAKHDLKKGKAIDFSDEYIKVLDDESAKQIDSAIFNNGIYLANAKVPHQVVTTNQARLCFSLRGCIKSDVPDDWENTVKHFKKIGLIID